MGRRRHALTLSVRLVPRASVFSSVPQKLELIRHGNVWVIRPHRLLECRISTFLCFAHSSRLGGRYVGSFCQRSNTDASMVSLTVA